MDSVRALEDDWQGTLDAVARARGLGVASTDVARLSPLVARLSATYNDRSASAPAADDRGALAARLLFSFVRDVPKGAGAVRELAAAGLLQGERPLRVLDVGAGLGAMTWGIARAAGGRAVEADLFDRSEGALALAAAIAAERKAGVRVRTHVGDAGTASGAPGYDIVVLGQVLSELDRESDAATRLARHVALVESLLRRVDAHGSLVIVEPALRDRSRHLHRIRDAFAARTNADVSVFAPCLHRAACPMLVRETDWCHEDLDVDLPAWLVPIARGAGLRFEGLTFSYLVLRKDGLTLRSRFAADASLFREVSGLVRTKGKTERIVCGVTPSAPGGVGVRAMRLDRADTAENAAWEEAHRGDLLAFDPPLEAARPRVEKEMRVTLLVDAPGGRR